MLERLARSVEPLLPELVFVGGHVAELLLTHPAAVRPRLTDDVDVIVAVTTRVGYHRFGDRLLALGLRHDAREGAPICRWRTEDGIPLDVMPVEGDVLGFTNPWYATAIQTAVEYPLASALTIRISSAAAFIATKWAAFHDRGQDDVLGSHDLEDILAVVAGRPELTREIAEAPGAVRTAIAAETRAFLESRFALHAVEGALPDARLIPGLVDDVMRRLRQIAELA
ncbi:MAG TPA: hypothetical protein VJT67_15710 [Longimicrobiaceae bacterium]|nr:hypothetical protein [Longimicrobiaceae bacterium]